MCSEPHTPDWRLALAKADAAPRCGAKTRSGFACEAPAMPNGRCRMHGGASTGPKTVEGRKRIARARTVHGYRSARWIALRRQIAQAGRELRELNKVSRAMLRNARL